MILYGNFGQVLPANKLEVQVVETSKTMMTMMMMMMYLTPFGQCPRLPRGMWRAGDYLVLYFTVSYQPIPQIEPSGCCVVSLTALIGSAE
jgi:hypothetical protein